jgi:hypothetical protein
MSHQEMLRVTRASTEARAADFFARGPYTELWMRLVEAGLTTEMVKQKAPWSLGEGDGSGGAGHNT